VREAPLILGKSTVEQTNVMEAEGIIHEIKIRVAGHVLL